MSDPYKVVSGGLNLKGIKKKKKKAKKEEGGSKPEKNVEEAKKQIDGRRWRRQNARFWRLSETENSSASSLKLPKPTRKKSWSLIAISKILVSIMTSRKLAGRSDAPYSGNSLYWAHILKDIDSNDHL